MARSAKSSVAVSTPKRPLPAAEPFPGSNYPPATTVTLSGTQTTQYRPNALSNRIFNLTNAVWNNAPTTLEYPIVIDDAGGGTPNGTNTILRGAKINGTLDLGANRGSQYDNYHSGIEHNSNSSAGYVIGENIQVSKMMDGYRFLGNGTAYLKRFYGSSLFDDFIEVEDLVGNVFIYDCLVEGCYSGISDREGPARSSGTITIDGLLLWLKPVKDLDGSSVEDDACQTTAGCNELNANGKGTFGIWKGEPASRNLTVRNSWFRLDRRTTWDINDGMSWPGTGTSDWGTGASISYTNCKLLWTGLDTAGNATATAYPGPALPAGVQLVTGQTALDMWNRAAFAWKESHGLGSVIGGAYYDSMGVV